MKTLKEYLIKSYLELKQSNRKAIGDFGHYSEDFLKGFMFCMSLQEDNSMEMGYSDVDEFVEGLRYCMKTIETYDEMKHILEVK